MAVPRVNNYGYRYRGIGTSKQVRTQYIFSRMFVHCFSMALQGSPHDPELWETCMNLGGAFPARRSVHKNEHAGHGRFGSARVGRGAMDSISTPFAGCSTTPKGIGVGVDRRADIFGEAYGVRSDGHARYRADWATEIVINHGCCCAIRQS